MLVTADDYGLTDATSQAIIRAHREGVVTATSVLAVAPGAMERMRWLEAVPDLAVGIHLALVGEDPPVLTADEIPTLVDARGRFPKSWRALLPRLATGSVDMDDVRREFDAQAEMAAEGRPLLHMDTHQHVHLWPSIAGIVVELAQDYGIHRVRVPRSVRRGIRGRVVARLAGRLDRRLADGELGRTDRFRGLDEAGRWTATRLGRAVDDLAAGEGSVEINAHPGPADDDDRARYQWSYRWGDELEALCDPALRAHIERSGFVLTGTLDG